MAPDFRCSGVATVCKSRWNLSQARVRSERAGARKSWMRGSFNNGCASNESWRPQQKPTLWEDILMPGSDLTGERSGPPPRLAVEGRSSGTRADAPHLRRHLRKAHAASPRGVAHGRGPRLAPRLPEPGDKTGLRLSHT